MESVGKRSTKKSPSSLGSVLGPGRRGKGRSGNSKIHFTYAVRSFMGYLEGTHKSAHTIKNYHLDVLAFQEFLQNSYDGKGISLDQIGPLDLERFREYLKEKGLRVNTRRRKILTVTQFLSYLTRRKKLSPEMGHKIPAPHKVERIPFTVSIRRLVEEIQGMGESALLDARNRCLLWTLAETGCLVSEVAELRYDQWEPSLDSLGEAAGYLHLGGKFSRQIPVSKGLLDAIQNLKIRSGSDPTSRIFLGFNKFGPMGKSAITPRGVELLVKHYGPRLGFPDLTPRTFRHSVILQWFQDGVEQSVIQARLGLKTTYAFRSYAPLLKSSLKTTSNVGMSPLGSEEHPE